METLLPPFLERSPGSCILWVPVSSFASPPSQMLFLDESTSDLNFLSCMVFARSSCIYTPGFNFYDGISYTTSTKTTCSSEFSMTAVILDIMFFHSLCYTFVVNGADIFCVEVTTVRTSRSISFTPSIFGVRASACAAAFSMSRVVCFVRLS